MKTHEWKALLCGPAAIVLAIGDAAGLRQALDDLPGKVEFARLSEDDADFQDLFEDIDLRFVRVLRIHDTVELSATLSAQHKPHHREKVMPEQPDIRRDEWDAEIERQIAKDDIDEDLVVSAMRDTGLLPTHGEKRRTLAEMKAGRSVAAYVKRIWEGVMHEATFEPLEPRHQGRLAARVLLICLEKNSGEEAAPDQGAVERVERAQRLVPDILEGFPHADAEFKQGLIAELEAEIT